MRKKSNAILIVILAAVLFLTSQAAFADVRPAAAKFPDRTIIIGTYAIVLDAMTEEVLKLAEASAEDGDQNKVYFKSDINKGTWYDITNSTNISQISTEKSNIVTNQVIDKVPLTHYTKSTGETVDLTTGKVVSTADLSDLTNPYNMPEMDEVAQERNIQRELKKNGGGKECGDKIASIDKVMHLIEKREKDENKKAVPKSEQDGANKIIELKKQITAMEKTITSLQSDSSVSERTIAVAVEEKMKLMDQRDALCYDIVYARMELESKELDYEKCQDLLEKYATAMTNIRAKLTEMGAYNDTSEGDDGTGSSGSSSTGGSGTGSTSGGESGGSGISSGGTSFPASSDFLGKKADALSEKVVEAAVGGNLSEIKSALENLAVLDSIRNDESNLSDDMKEKQLSMLNSLRGEAASAVNDAVKAANSNAEYATAKKDGSSQATLEKLREDIAESLSEAVGAVMNIDDKIDSRKSDPADTERRLKETEALVQSVENGVSSELKPAVSSSLQSQKEQLAQQKAEVQLKSLDAYQKLNAAKEENQKKAEALYEGYMGAVQNNNMVQANAIKEQMNRAANNRSAAEETMKKMESAVTSGDLKATVADGVIEDKGGVMNEASGILNDIAANAVSGEVPAGTAGTGAGTTGSGAGTSGAGTAGGQAGTSGSTPTASKAGDARYTSDEISSLNQAVNKLSQADSKSTYLPPWSLVFTEYNVKLTTPLLMQGKTVYVPAEDLAAQIGAQAIKSKTSNATVIRKGSGLIEYIPGDTTIYVNDKKTVVKPAPYAVYGGKVYIPLNCFEKAFGFADTTVDGVITVSQR